MPTQAFLGFNAPIQNLMFSNKVVVPEKGVLVVRSTLPRHGTSNRRIRLVGATRPGRPGDYPEQPPLWFWRRFITTSSFVQDFTTLVKGIVMKPFITIIIVLDIHGVPYGMHYSTVSQFSNQPREQKSSSPIIF